MFAAQCHGWIGEQRARLCESSSAPPTATPSRSNRGAIYGVEAPGHLRASDRDITGSGAWVVPERVTAGVPEGQKASGSVRMLAVAQHRAGVRWPDLVVAGIGPPDPPRAGGLTFHAPLASAHVPSTVA